MKNSFLFVTVAALLCASCTTQANVNPELLNQFADRSAAPVDQVLLDDDEKLKESIRTHGPVPTMEAVRQAAYQRGIDCHDRAHELGRLSFEHFGNEVFKLSIPECHSGFYHGSIEAFFKKNGTAKLDENLPLICNADMNAFFTHQCLHGIGHGLMAWTSYELPEALEYCNLVPADQGKASCRSGVFMENIVGGLADSPEAKERGHMSAYLNDDPQYPCNAVKEEYKSDCYFLQTDRMLTLSKNGFESVARECEKAPRQYQYSCFGSMGRTVGGISRGRPTEAIRNCQFAIDTQNRISCILGAGQDTFWDKNGQQLALDFCAVVPENEGKQQCYDTIISRAYEILTAADITQFCASLPTAYNQQCSKRST
jgi:hypothetical protein